MPSQAISGVGTQFRRYDSPTSTWENIAEVNSISGPSMSKETIDVTDLGSEGGWREFIDGFKDGGEVSLNMNFTRDTYEQMFNDFKASNQRFTYEIILPDEDNTTLVFDGIVTECPLDIPTDDKVTSDVTIKVSGEPTLESGSGS